MGSGDTRYVLLAILCLPAFVLVMSTYVVLVHLDGDTYAAWGTATACMMVTAIAFLLRFLGGRWKSMRMMEAAPTVARCGD